MTWYIYDYFNHSPGNQYWRSTTGGAPSETIRGAIEYMRKKVGEIRCNEWRAEEYIGGFHAADGEAAIYRVYNGGRDDAGRPHRWILLLLAGPTNRFKGSSLTEFLEQPPFSDYGMTSVPSEATFPNVLPSFESQHSAPPCSTVDSFQKASPEVADQARSAFLRLVNGENEGMVVVQNIGGVKHVWSNLSSANRGAAPTFLAKNVETSKSSRPPALPVASKRIGSSGTAHPRQLFPRLNWLIGVYVACLLFVAIILVNKFGTTEGRESKKTKETARDNPSHAYPIASSSPVSDNRETASEPHYDRSSPENSGDAASISREMDQFDKSEERALIALSDEIVDLARRRGVRLSNATLKGKKLTFEVEFVDAQPDRRRNDTKAKGSDAAVPDSPPRFWQFWRW